MQTTFLMIRHAQIQANIDKAWHGSTDSPLTEKGLTQAARLAEHVHTRYDNIGAIYCSPLQRTRATSAPIAERLRLEANPHDGLREYCIGDWEGTSFLELQLKHQFFETLKRNHEFAPPNGESVLSVSTRVAAALDEIAEQHPGETVIIVSHGAAMALGLSMVLHASHEQWDNYFFKNTSITEVQVRPEPLLISFNQTPHLDK